MLPMKKIIKLFGIFKKINRWKR